MTVEVHLINQGIGISYEKVINAYTKGGMYCVYLENGKVHKYPMVNIFRVKESYK